MKVGSRVASQGRIRSSTPALTAHRRIVAHLITSHHKRSHHAPSDWKACVPVRCRLLGVRRLSVAVFMNISCARRRGNPPFVQHRRYVCTSARTLSCLLLRCPRRRRPPGGGTSGSCQCHNSFGESSLWYSPAALLQQARARLPTTAGTGMQKDAWRVKLLHSIYGRSNVDKGAMR